MTRVAVDGCDVNLWVFHDSKQKIFGSYGRGLGPHVTFLLRADKSAFFSTLQKDIHFCSDLKDISHVAFIKIHSFQFS